MTVTSPPSFRWQLFIPLFLLSLSSCAGDDVTRSPDREREEFYKYGSVLSGRGGVDILDMGNDSGRESGFALGVNAFLWRASLDTVSFLPLRSADPFGGVILTDWYSPPDQDDERFRLNLLILDRTLRADGVRVAIFRQIRQDGEWRDAPAATGTARQIEDAILTRARQLRVAQIESE